MRCQVEKGFFVVKTCRKVAVGKCQKCQKKICAEHAKGYIKSVEEINTSTELSETTQPQKLICLECFAESVKDPSRAALGSDLWYYSTRRKYNDHSRTFDDFDEDSFDTTATNEIDDTDGSASFYDS